MIGLRPALAAVACLLASAALAGDVPGLDVGTPAPALEGGKWFNTKDGKAPDLKGKVYLVDFWFGG
jgi:hypothetical protein